MQDYAIIRTLWVFSFDRDVKNFAYRLMKSLRAGQPVDVPDDQLGNPTHARDVAKATVRLAEEGGNGIFHVVGDYTMNKHEFALKIARKLGLDEKLVRPVKTVLGPGIAPRPVNAGMTGIKMLGVEDAIDKYDGVLLGEG